MTAILAISDYLFLFIAAFSLIFLKIIAIFAKLNH